MRVAVLPGVGRPLEIEERPVPVPGPGEVRVRVEACGVCGSDLFLQAGGFGVPLPVVPGHEACGQVDAIGEEVTGWRRGERVALYYIDADPEGRWSKRGREQLEPSLTRMGVDVDGAFAEYVIRPAHTLIRPPTAIAPAELAVLTDAVATPYHALVRVARLQAGETVLVLGIGGVGSNAVQLARGLGGHVVAASRTPEKLRLAERLGAHACIRLGGDDDEHRIRAIAPDGFDVVLQCVGSAAVDRLAVDLAGPGGRVVLIGAALEGFTVRATELIWREVAIMGSRGFTAQDITDVLRRHADGDIGVDHLIASERPLAEANAALADLREGRALRTVLRPDWP